MKKIIVIGGGAAGMMAAISAAEDPQNEITILERNTVLGWKLNITGKGRCNVTNDCDVETLLTNVPRNAKFLYSAFHAFSAQDAKSFFEQLGVPLKTERGQRVFPVSDHAKDISGALKNKLHKDHIAVMQGCAAKIETKDGAVSGVTCTDGRFLAADRVILATGGLSYPRTGSDGIGLKMAVQAGHSLTEPVASLIRLKTEESDPAELEGLALKNIAVTLLSGKKKVYQDFGELVFTADGVSGPVILSGSAHICRKLAETPFRLEIDLKPALDAETLDKRILRDFEENINRDFINAVSSLLPGKLIPVIIRRSGIDPHKKVNLVTKEERAALVSVIKAYALTVCATGPIEEAIITSGGIKIKEINPKTMESKLVPGLYFAGEIIDVDAYTGGFNLQIAWSTGRAAGKAQCFEDKEQES